MISNLIMATQTGGLLKPFAWILGKILEVIYDGFAYLGIYNIALCIIVFTFVVRMLMLPMQIKQQKFSKMNSIMQPEIQAIQKKYKDKKDQASQMAMQEEMRAVYDKYGTSPTGGCLQLIVQMPILFALYRVIMNVPAYVKPVKELYTTIIHGLSQSQIDQFFVKMVDGKAHAIGKAGSLINGNELNTFIDAMANKNSTGIQLAKNVNVQDILNSSTNTAVASKIEHLNNFFGFDISATPSSLMATMGIIALLIPVLSGLFQFLSVKISQSINKMPNQADNPMAGSMKWMNIMMPLFSVYMCYILQIGIGIYWCAGSIVMVLQQVFIAMRLKNVDVNDIIEQNKEKAAVKAEKRKEKQGIYRERVLEQSRVNARTTTSSSTMSAEEKEEKIRRAKERAGKGSIASRAGLVDEYNKKNK